MDAPPILAARYSAPRSDDEATLCAAVTGDIRVTYRGRPGLLPWTGTREGVA